MEKANDKLLYFVQLIYTETGYLNAKLFIIGTLWSWYSQASLYVSPYSNKTVMATVLMWWLTIYKCYCNKRVIFLIYTLIFICMLKIHGLCTCTLHNSETLEPLTWIRVCTSHHYARTLSLSLSLSRTHVLYRDYWTSVNIRNSNRSLDLSFLYINLATYLTLML